MPAINVPILTVWMFVAVVSLCSVSELFCKANTTEVATTESYATTDFSSGKKNLSLTVLINDNVTLNCSFDDYSEKQNIVWWFDDNIFFAGSDTFLGNISNVRVDFNGSISIMQIKNMQPHNVGKYRCTLASEETGLIVYIKIRRPITHLSIVFVNESQTNPTNITLKENEKYLFICYENEPSLSHYIWKINGRILKADNTSSIVSTQFSDGEMIKYNYSKLLYHVKENINAITCQTGNHSTGILVEVETDHSPLLDLKPFLIALGSFALVVLLLGSICYFALTCRRRKEKKPVSCRSSIYSMPSIVSNDHADSNSHPSSRRDGDGMSDVEKKKWGHVTNTISPYDLQYVDPIVQHPTTTTYNTFERNLRTHGLQLHSLMSKDDLNEFWEATLCGGSFNGRIIVRSLSGKATMDLLEEFRKFMISVQELPHHPNIWSVHGVSKEKLPYRICYEYHDQTTVRDYLLGNFQSHSESPHNQTQTLVVLAYQIVDAMVFLKSHAFDHVAIRTEKILLDHTEDCKLYDFSLSSQSQQIALNASREDQILPWLAPEVIFLEEYNQWADIWAFGVVLWELWCGGRAPHCGKSRENVEKDLRSQQFLVQPPNCPGAIYSLMLSCWKNNASERKMFSDLKKDIYDLRTATESSWYGPEDYSTVGSSSFYTVLDNTYDAQ